MSAFDQEPTFYHSFLVEGISSPELLNFAKSIKMDQVVRGASHCEVSLFQIDGVDKLEAKNFFSSEGARDEYVANLRPPNDEALTEMGIRLSSHMGTVHFNSLKTSTASTSSIPQQGLSPVSQSTQPNKCSWPELQNTPSSEAVKIITGERPDVKAMLVPQGSMVTMDVRMDRVRVFYDKDSGYVTSVPKIG